MLKLGYHPATYLRQDIGIADALADISATGWNGFEWSPGGLGPHYDDVADYRRYLAGVHLEVSGIYCSSGFRNAEEIRQWQDTIDATIVFAKAIGTRIVLIDGGSLELAPGPESTRRIARLANEVGKRITDAGLTCTWHQHWGTLFQYPADFDALMDATDPELVGFTPDTAQMALGGFDVPGAFQKYLARIRYVHFKDLGSDRRFVELGRGNVDFPPLAEMLKGADFDGWVVVDLDYTSLDPCESSRENLRYLSACLSPDG